ncbi:unnamed protein product [Pedinophyceae sp. YPF-701]|nr:unnamed protein product [Pedinophyceae sp. YPF-701]
MMTCTRAIGIFLAVVAAAGGAAAAVPDKATLVVQSPGWHIRGDWSSKKGEENPWTGSTLVLREDPIVQRNYAVAQAALGVDDGVFVEIGGERGINGSTSLMLEGVHGWKGVLIEADPDCYQELRQQRPWAVVVNAAACAEARTVRWAPESLSTLDGPESLGTRALSSAGIWEFMPVLHKRAFFPKYLVATEGGGIVDNAALVDAAFTKITCLSLSDILTYVHAPRVDYLIVDVEGAELEVLRSVDFQRTPVKLVSVEVMSLNTVSKERLDAIVDVMAANGFVAFVPEEVLLALQATEDRAVNIKHSDAYFLHQSLRPCESDVLDRVVAAAGGRVVTTCPQYKQQ